MDSKDQQRICLLSQTLYWWKEAQLTGIFALTIIYLFKWENQVEISGYVPLLYATHEQY